MLLITKYSPKTLDDVRLNDRNLDAILKWCNSHLQNLPDPEKPALLLVGSPGIGKTTIARCIANDCDFHLIELNASDIRTKEQLKDFSPQKSLFNQTSMIVFDEADSLYTKKEEGGDPTQIIKKLVKSLKYPIIFTANNQWKIPKDLKSLCEVIQIYRPSVSQLKTHLQEICQKENINCPKELIEAASLTQDYRLAINMIELNLILQKTPKNPSLMENTKRLVLNQPTQFKDSKSLLYYLDENGKNLYDPLDLYEIYEILSRCDQLKKRGQTNFANALLKEIPKTTLEEFEIIVPAFKEKE